ncbi:hypothetical protein AArcCO_2079 [Halalkaliarchaeum sp. AArc-CO]|nr:hypothetical protein AArcCO_2079 [Halalkaliarchaeum sp. AArc-CO]
MLYDATCMFCQPWVHPSVDLLLSALNGDKHISEYVSVFFYSFPNIDRDREIGTAELR